MGIVLYEETALIARSNGLGRGRFAMGGNETTRSKKEESKRILGKRNRKGNEEAMIRRSNLRDRVEGR